VAFSPRCISAAEVPRGEVRLHPARSKQSATHNCPRGTTDHGLILSPPPFCLHSGTLTTTLLSPQWSGERTGSSTFDLVQRCFLLYTLPHTHQTLHLSLCLSPTDSLCVQVVEDAEEDKRMLRSMRTRVATRDGREFGRAAAKASASTPAVSGDMAYRKVCVCVVPTRVHPHRPCLATWRTARCVCVWCPPAFIHTGRVWRHGVPQGVCVCVAHPRSSLSASQPPLPSLDQTHSPPRPPRMGLRRWSPTRRRRNRTLASPSTSRWVVTTTMLAECPHRR
jgi:hypothetical protein